MPLGADSDGYGPTRRFECLPAPRWSQPAQGMLITLLPVVHTFPIERAVKFQGLFEAGFRSCVVVLLAALGCGVFWGKSSQRFKERRSCFWGGPCQARGPYQLTCFT